jgi:hypothetical protein
MRNRSKILVLAIASLVSACGPSTPLTDSLAALRRGDREALLLAKEDALAALRTAAPVACTFDPERERKRFEVAAINRLDNPNLFGLPRHERLVYAVNVIIAEEEDFAKIDVTERGNCAATQEKASAVERALDSWFAAEILLQAENYKNNMAQAAQHLTSIGLPAKWPPPTLPHLAALEKIKADLSP